MPKRLELLVTELIRQEYGREKSELDKVIREIRLLDQYLAEAKSNPDIIPKAYSLLLDIARDKAFQTLVEKGVISEKSFKKLENDLAKAYQEYELLKEARNHVNDPDWLLEAAKRNPELADYFKRLALAALLRIYEETGDKHVADRIAELAKTVPGYEWLSWLANPKITDQDITFILSKIGVIAIPRNISFQCSTPLCRYWGELPENVKKSLERYALAKYIADLIKQGDYEELAEISTKVPELEPYVDFARKLAKVSTAYSQILNEALHVLRSVRDVATARAAATGLAGLVAAAQNLVAPAEELDKEAERLLGSELGLADAVKQLMSVLSVAETALVIYDNISENAAALRLALMNRDRDGVAKFFGRLVAAVMNAEDAATQIDCSRAPRFQALCKTIVNWIGELVTLGLDTLYNVYVAVMSLYPSLAKQLYKEYGEELNLPKPVKGRLGEAEEVYKEVLNYLATVADKLHREAERIGGSDPVKTLEKMLESTGAYTLLYIIGIPVAAYQFARAEIGALAALLRGKPGLAARIEKQVIEQMMPRNAEQLVAMALAGLVLGKLGGALGERLAEKPLFDRLYRVKAGIEERVLEALEKLSEKLGKNIEELRVAEPGKVLEKYTITMDVAREAFDQAVNKLLESLPEEERLAVARMVSEELRKAIARNERLGDLVKRLEGEMDAYERLLEDLRALRENLANISKVVKDIETLRDMGAWEELPDRYKYLQEIAAVARSVLSDKVFRDALPDLARQLDKALAELQKGSLESLGRVEYILNIYSRLRRLMSPSLVERLRAYIEETKRIDPGLAREAEEALEEYLRNPGPETWRRLEEVEQRARLDIVKEEIAREFPELARAGTLGELEKALQRLASNIARAEEVVPRLWELARRFEELYQRYARTDAELASMFKKLYEVVAEGERRDIEELMKEGKLREAMYRYVPRDLETELEIYEKLSRLEKLVRGRPELERLVRIARENIDKPRVAQRLLAELEEKIKAKPGARAAAAKALSETEKPGGEMKEVVVAEKTLARIFRASPETIKRLAEEAGKNKEIRIYCCGSEWIVERKLTVEPGRTVIEYLVRSGEDYARVVREYRIEDGYVYAVTRIEHDPEARPETVTEMETVARRAAEEDTPLAVLVDTTGRRLLDTIPNPLKPVVEDSETLAHALALVAPQVTRVNNWPALRVGATTLVLLTPDQAERLLPSTDWEPVTIVVDGEPFHGYRIRIGGAAVTAVVTPQPDQVVETVKASAKHGAAAQATPPTGTVTATKPGVKVSTGTKPRFTAAPVQTGPGGQPPPPGPGAGPGIRIYNGWVYLGGGGGAAKAAGVLRREVLALL